MAGYFTDASMIRRIHREQVVAFSAPRALLMQAAHPVAFAGFFMSTGALDRPYERLARTARVLDTVLFGERDAADSATAAVRMVHARMRGTLPDAVGRFPAGTPWAADDQALLLWILATLADSGALVYQRYVGRLSRAQRDSYWDDYRVVGSLFGLRGSDMPADSGELESYVHEMVTGEVLRLGGGPRTRGRDRAAPAGAADPAPTPGIGELHHRWAATGADPAPVRPRMGPRAGADATSRRRIHQAPAGAGASGADAAAPGARAR